MVGSAFTSVVALIACGNHSTKFGPPPPGTGPGVTVGPGPGSSTGSTTTATGTGGAASTTGTGGAASSSTTGSGGAGGSGGILPGPQSDCEVAHATKQQACSSCVQMSIAPNGACESDWQNCTNDVGCLAINMCVAGASTNAEIDACIDPLNKDISHILYDQVLSCLFTDCPVCETMPHVVQANCPGGTAH